MTGISKKTITILSGATDSDLIRLDFDTQVVALIFPDAMTGTTVKIMAVNDWTDDTEVFNTDGSAYDIAVKTDGYVPLKLDNINAISAFRLKSSAAEGADRTIIAVTRPL